MSLRTLEACVKLLAKVCAAPSAQPTTAPGQPCASRSHALRLELPSQALPSLTTPYRERCDLAAGSVLHYVVGALDTPDQLPKPRDKSLTAISSLLRQVHAMLGTLVSPSRAMAQVLPVQRKLVEAMLATTTFNMQLAGVREINLMLDSVTPAATPLIGCDAPPAGAGAAARDEGECKRLALAAVAWVNDSGLLRTVLRSHLHLKQYVEQVERIMRALLRHSSLPDEHLDVVWTMTQREDTFEETKANLYALLAALAADFSPRQLDSLFAHFEHARGVSFADALKTLGLVSALARGDATGAMADRLTGLLWNKLQAPDAPAEVLAVMSEVCAHYGSFIPGHREALVERCVASIRARSGALQSVRLLSYLCEQHATAAGHAAAAAAGAVGGEVVDAYAAQRAMCGAWLQLSQRLDLKALLLDDVEAFAGEARAAMTAGATAELWGSRSVALQDRLAFLLLFLRSSGAALDEADVRRLWDACVAGCATPGDTRVANWFLSASSHFTPSHDARFTGVLTTDAVAALLRITCAVPPALLTKHTFNCLLRMTFCLAILDGKAVPSENPQLHQLPMFRTLEVEGLPQMWAAAAEGPPEVAHESIHWLSRIFTSPSGSAAEKHELRATLLRQAAAWLDSAAASVRGSAGAEPVAVERAMRALNLLNLLLSVDQKHHAALHALGLAPAAHGATYGGRTLEVEFLQGCNVKPVPRLRHAFSANEYAQNVRGYLARALNLPPSRLRILFQGAEVSSYDQAPCSIFDGKPLMYIVKPDMAANTAALLTSVLASNIDVPDPSDAPPMDLEDTACVAPLPLAPADDAPFRSGTLMRALQVEHAAPSARQLLAAVPGLVDTLFDLGDCGLPSLCEPAVQLLNALPTHQPMRSRLAMLLAPDVDAPADTVTRLRAQLAEALSTATTSRAYALQVLEGLMLPVNDCVDAQTAKASQAAFLSLNGPELVLAALQPGTLPGNSGAGPLRALYLSGLRLLHRTAADAPVDAPANSVAAADMLDVDSAADRVAADTGDMLVWLLPRTAMGSLGSADSPANSRPADRSDTAMELQTACTSSAACEPIDDDLFITMSALELLAAVVRQRHNGLALLLSHPDVPRLLVDLLLRCPLAKVREGTARLCSELAGEPGEAAVAASVSPLARVRGASGGATPMASGSGGSGSGAALGGGGGTPPRPQVGGADAGARRQLLTLLLDARGVADELPGSSGEFFRLTAQLLHSQAAAAAAASGADAAALDAVLAQEVAALARAQPCSKAGDYRLEGHLELVYALVKGGGKHYVSTPSGASLLTFLLHKYLFPELGDLLAEAEAAQGGGGDQGRGLAVAAVAGTPGTRQRAFSLATALATRDAAALQEVAAVLHQLHVDGDSRGRLWEGQVGRWDQAPSAAARPHGSYVGLANGGATCYMNSVFQQLFMQPAIRRGVLAADDRGEGEPSESVLCQLQSTFGALTASSLDHHLPRAFWLAFKDYDGQPVNVREHQDALEFLLRLQEQVDAAVKRAAPQQHTGQGEPAAPAALGAIERVLGGEQVSEIVCRACPLHRSEKAETVVTYPLDMRGKAGLVEALGSYVQGELLEGDNKWECEQCGRKVDAVKRQLIKTLPHTLCFQLKRFEFDYETMQRLKVKDRFEFPLQLDMRPFTRDADPSPDAPPPPPDAPPRLPDEHYLYTLMGVVVHSGSAFAGHYYSYIRERVEGPGGAVSAGPWHVFDDRRVEPYDASNLERDTFGGRYTADSWNAEAARMVPTEFDRPNSAYMLFFERLGEPLGGGEEGDAMRTEEGGGAGAVQLPPRVAQEVRRVNAECIYESHVLCGDYFSFVRALVDANVEGASRKRRRPHAQAPPSLVDHLCVDLSFTFLLHIHSRAAAALREDGAAWVTTLGSLLDSSPACTRWFMAHLTDPAHMNTLYILLARAPQESVRELWRQLCLIAFKAAASHGLGATNLGALCDAMPALPAQSDEEELDAAEAPGTSGAGEGLAVGVSALVASIIGMLRRTADIGLRNKVEPNALSLIGCVTGYAQLGAVQRAHLVHAEALEALFDYAHQRLYQLAVRFDLRAAAAQAVWGALSLLVRGTGGAYGSSGRGPLNPYALPGDPAVPPLYDRVVAQFHSDYSQTLNWVLEGVLSCSEARDLACYLCWESPRVSNSTLTHLLNKLADPIVEAELLSGALTFASMVLALDDVYGVPRAQLFVVGRVTRGHMPTNMPGLVDILAAHQVAFQKRVALLRWVLASVQQGSAGPFLQDAILQHKQIAFIHALDAMRDQLETLQNSQTVGWGPLVLQDIAASIEAGRQLVPI